MSDRVVLFVHVPKSAGTTFYSMAATAECGLMRLGSRRLLRLRTDWNSFEHIGKYLQSLSLKQRAELRFVSGHMLFGLHELFEQQVNYVSFVREPASRLVSCWRNITRDRNNVFHETACSMDMREFVESGICYEYDNGQVRRLSGVGASVPIGQLSTEHLEAARVAIRERFLLVGLTERFDESVLLMRNALGWPRCGYVPWNLGPTGSPPPPESDIAMLRESNQLDAQLYCDIEQDLNERVAKGGASFQAELAATRAFNAGAYRYWHALVIAPFRRLRSSMGVTPALPE